MAVAGEPPPRAQALRIKALARSEEQGQEAQAQGSGLGYGSKEILCLVSQGPRCLLLEGYTARNEILPESRQAHEVVSEEADSRGPIQQSGGAGRRLQQI